MSDLFFWKINNRRPTSEQSCMLKFKSLQISIKCVLSWSARTKSLQQSLTVIFEAEDTTVIKMASSCDAVLQRPALNQAYGPCKSAMLETKNGFSEFCCFSVSDCEENIRERNEEKKTCYLVISNNLKHLMRSTNNPPIILLSSRFWENFTEYCKKKKKKRGKWSYSALALEAFALLLTSRGGGAFRIQLPDAGSNLIAVWTIPPAQTMQTVSFTATVAVWGGVLSQRERAHRSFPGPPHQILIIPLIDFSFEWWMATEK